MSGQQHHIYQTVFDIDFFSKEKAHDLQDDISHLFNIQVSKEIDELLSEYSSPGETIQIEKLILNIGKLRYDDLAYQLPAKIAEALREELDKLELKNTKTVTSKYKTIRSEVYDLELFGHYLHTGIFRWPEQRKNKEPEDVLTDLIKKDTAGLIKLIKKLGKKEQVRKRIAYQLNEPAVHKIIYALEPAQAALIISYVSELEKEEEKKIKTETTELKRAKYYFVLTYLLVERGSVFNTKNFVRSILKQMAAHFNIKYNEFLLTLVQNIRKYISTSQRYLLPHVIRDIFLEDFKLSTELVTQPDNQELFEQVYSKRDILDEHVFYFLEKGYFPAGSIPLSKENLQEALQYLSHDRFEKLKLFLTKANTKQIVKNLVHYFPEEQNNFLIRKYQPEAYNWIHSFQLDLLQAQQQFSFIRGGEGINGSDKIIKESVLEALIGSQQSIFNKERFLLAVLRIMAQKQGTETIRFIHHTKDVLKRSDKATWGVFLSEFETLEEPGQVTAATTIHEKDAVITKPGDAKKEGINIVKYFLNYGKLPWWSSMTYAGYITDLWDQLVIREKNRQLIRFIKQQIHRSDIRKNILQVTHENGLFYPELPTSPNDGNPLQQQDWIIIKNKVSYTTYQVLREAHLLYSFLKEDNRKEVLWEEMMKIVASYQIDAGTFYAHILQIKEFIPGIYVDGFFSLLNVFISENTWLGNRLKKISTVHLEERKKTEVLQKIAAKEVKKEILVSADKQLLVPGEETIVYTQTEQVADREDLLLAETTEDPGEEVGTVFYTYLEALLDYLHTGSMPTSVQWNVRELINKLIMELQRNPRLAKNKKLYVSLTNGTARHRLLSALEADELEYLMQHLFYR